MTVVHLSADEHGDDDDDDDVHEHDSISIEGVIWGCHNQCSPSRLPSLEHAYLMMTTARTSHSP